MKKQVILCVDDELIVLESLKNELSQYFDGRYVIEIAESAEEALEVIAFLQKRNLEVIVVISDYVMPNKNGDEFLIELHELEPYIIKILLTGQANLAGVMNAIQSANLYRYISKPWESNDLIMTLETAIQSYSQAKELHYKNTELIELNLDLEKKVEERTREIKEQSEQIKASIRYALRIQNALRPSNETIAKYLPNHFVFFRPKDIVSGDFYWFAEKENKIILVLGDCTGHGVPGAFMSMIGELFLNQIVHDKEIHSPDLILDLMNKQLKSLWEKENAGIKDGMDTAVVCIDMESKTMEYAGAKSHLFIIQNGIGDYVRADKFSIDGDLKNIYTKKVIDISQPTQFYLYSDGFQDQFGGAENQKFMGRRFRDFLAEIQADTMEVQGTKVAEKFLDWKGDYNQIDDVLVIGVELPIL